MRVLPDSCSQAKEAGWESARPIKLGCVGVGGSIGGNGGSWAVSGSPWPVSLALGAVPRARVLWLAGVALNLQDARLEDSLGAMESGEGRSLWEEMLQFPYGAWGGGRETSPASSGRKACLHSLTSQAVKLFAPALTRTGRADSWPGTLSVKPSGCESEESFILTPKFLVPQVRCARFL